MEYKITTTNIFDRWLKNIRSNEYRARITKHIRKMSLGHFGDYKFIGVTMKVAIKEWDASEYLDSPEMVREYLKEMFEDGDQTLIVKALGDVAKAQGMTEIAEKTGLNRQNLYKALSGGQPPKFDTVIRVVEAVGYKLTVA